MSKHTEWPWLFKRDKDGDRSIEADGKSLMCDMTYYPWCPYSDADWHLISAAPELLEALKELMECPYDIDPATVSKDGLEATMQKSPYQVVLNMSIALQRVRNARAVIAKAEGTNT